MKTDYRKLESDLKELLGLMIDFTDHEVSEVEHFLNVGEYGLAFETLCGIVKEEVRTVSTDGLTMIKELAERMEIDSSWWYDIVQKE